MIYTRLQHLQFPSEGIQLAGSASKKTSLSPVKAEEPHSDANDPKTNNKVMALDVLDDAMYTAKEREAAVKAILTSFKTKIRHRSDHHLGYPLNQDLDFTALSELMAFNMNNLGDPFIESNYGVHSREFEVGVLNWFAKLWDIELDQYWGCVTTCGTEGNLHGIYCGRENLPDGVLYASTDSHYSVFKAARMYRMDSVKVKSQRNSEIDYDDLRRALTENKHRPAIISLNIGTTVKGAVDDLDKVVAILQEVGYTEDRFYIHLDGALAGIMLPFMKEVPSKLSFKRPVGSISVSGHKFIGTPAPCGVIIMRMRNAMAMSSDVEYLNSRDATIMGSRNGQAALQLWYQITRKGNKGIQRDVEKCMYNASLLKDMLLAAGFEASRNVLSNIVVFERPMEEAFVRRWQLACEGPIAHIIVMPSNDIPQLEKFVMEYIKSNIRVAASNTISDSLSSEMSVDFDDTLRSSEGFIELEDPPFTLDRRASSKTA